jgi:uncharacterized protein RhaS with RHS repeats
VTRAVDPLGHSLTMPRTELTLSKSGKRTAAATTRSFLYLELATPAALTSTDAAGKTTTNTWNARGQLLTTTNPLNETTTYTYNAQGYLS